MEDISRLSWTLDPDRHTEATEFFWALSTTSVGVNYIVNYIHLLYPLVKIMDVLYAVQ